MSAADRHEGQRDQEYEAWPEQASGDSPHLRSCDQEGAERANGEFPRTGRQQVEGRNGLPLDQRQAQAEAGDRDQEFAAWQQSVRSG